MDFTIHCRVTTYARERWGTDEASEVPIVVVPDLGSPLAKNNSGLRRKVNFREAFMTDRNRNQSQHTRAQQSSDDPQRAASRLDDDAIDQDVASSSRNRSSERESADDRGLGSDRARRSFGGDREHDELGSDLDDNRAVEDSDDVGYDDGFGGPDRSDR